MPVRADNVRCSGWTGKWPTGCQNDANDSRRTWRELLDHLVGAAEDRRRNGEAERLGGVQIDDQFENGRLLDRQVGGPGALEDRSGINADLSIGRRKARAIADQAAGRSVFTDPIDRRNGMACCQRHDLLAPAVDEWFGGDDERVGGALDEGGEGGVYFAFGAGVQDGELHSLGAR